jgi:hypothetical protein
VVTRLAVRPEERDAGALYPDRHAEARQALLHDGLVVLDDAIDVGHVDRLRERMEADLAEVASRETGEKRHNKQGHLQHQPPVDAAFLFPDVIANPVAVSLTRAVVGTVRLVLYTANTNLPGSVRQHVHADLNQLWPDLVIARDIRLWHGGVPNTTGTPRVMLAMCYAATWYAATPLTFGADAERVISTLCLPVPAECSREPFDYLDPKYSGLAGPQMTFQGFHPKTSGARS